MRLARLFSGLFLGFLSLISERQFLIPESWEGLADGSGYAQVIAGNADLGLSQIETHLNYGWSIFGIVGSFGGSIFVLSELRE